MNTVSLFHVTVDVPFVDPPDLAGFQTAADTALEGMLPALHVYWAGVPYTERAWVNAGVWRAVVGLALTAPEFGARPVVRAEWFVGCPMDADVEESAGLEGVVNATTGYLAEALGLLSSDPGGYLAEHGCEFQAAYMERQFT